MGEVIISALEEGKKEGRVVLEPGWHLMPSGRDTVCLQPAAPASVFFVLGCFSVLASPGGGFGPVGYDLSFPFLDLGQSASEALLNLTY